MAKKTTTKSAAKKAAPSTKSRGVAGHNPDAPNEQATYGDQTVLRGAGGETHQIAGGDVPVLTTQQGIPVADDQNTLRIGDRDTERIVTNRHPQR